MFKIGEKGIITAVKCDNIGVYFVSTTEKTWLWAIDWGRLYCNFFFFLVVIQFQNKCSVSVKHIFTRKKMPVIERVLDLLNCKNETVLTIAINN